MSEADIQELLEMNRSLKRRQETPDTPEALATIPTLKLSDLDKQVKTIPLAVAEKDGGKILYHDLFTNGIVYLDLGFNLHALPKEYLPLVSLFGRSLLEVGTASQDYVKLSQRIGRETGGIRHTILTTRNPHNGQNEAWLFLRGKATVAQGGELLSILKDVLLTVRLDNLERFKQMVLEDKAGQESGLVPMGHRIVNLRLRSMLDEADWAGEKMSGLSYLFFLRQLAEDVENNWPAVLEKLEAMRRMLVNRSSMISNVTLDESGFDDFQPKLQGFLSSLPAQAPDLHAWKPESEPVCEGFTIPAQVNYVGKGSNLYAHGYKLKGSIFVINNYLSSTFLWERIRVQGGAYGGFCLFDQHTGVYDFVSYRDPNIIKTLENYDQVSDFLHHLGGTRLTSEELNKSIIGAIGDMDAYQLPDAKGYTSMVRYMSGDTDTERQQARNQILSTTAEDFHAFGDWVSQIKDDGLVVVMGSQDAITQANNQRGGFLDVIKVL